MDKLTEIVTAQCALNDAKAAANRQRFNRFSKTGQKASGMIDPIRCWVSGSASVHILQDARDPDPLRFGSLAFRIAPPLSRLSTGLAHAKNNALSHHPKEPTRT